MPEPFVQSHIRRMLLFEPLPEEQLALIAEAFQVLRFEPGAVVFRQGQPAQGLFYFVSGRGVLTHYDPDPEAPGGGRNETVIEDITANEYVGETALFASTLEHASLRIVESSIVLFLARERFANLLLQHPELRMNLGAQRAEQHQTLKPLFKGQRPDEVVLQVFKRHWWSYARFVWVPVLLGTALVIAAFLLAGATIVAVSMIGLALILPAGVMAFLYQEWQDDLIVVTSQRVVRVRNLWLGLQNSLTEIPLERVQEVGVIAPPADPFARLFNYGTVSVRTAGDLANVSMTMVPRPELLRTLIFTHRDQVRRSEAERKRREIESEVEKVLGLPASEPIAAAAAPEPPPVEAKRRGTWGFLRMKYVNEEGELVFRKHYTVWFRHILLPLMMMLFALFIMALSFFGLFPSYNTIAFFGAVPLFLLGALWFYLGDWDWRNDLFILGDRMLTLIRKRPLWLQNEVDQIRLEKVDSVVSLVSGVTNNLLDRGTVKISLIGDEEAKIIENVFQPQEIQAEVSRRLTRLRQTEQMEDAERQREAITEYLSAYHARVAGFEAQKSQNTVAREVSPTLPAAPEPPPKPIRDRNRPPRIPRTLPEE